MTTKLRKTLTVLVAIAVVAGMAGAGAAAIGWDTSTTDATTTDSDVSGSSTTVTFDPGNTSEEIYVEVKNATTSNLSVELTPAQSGVDYVAYENSTPDEEDATYGHYAWNISHAEIEDVPRGHDGATYNLTVYNTSNGSAILSTEVVLDSSTTDTSRAIMAVTDDSGTDGAALTPLVADRMELSKETAGWFGISSLSFMSFGDENETDLVTWSGYTTVDGANTTVTVDMANSTTASAYDSAASSAKDGEVIKGSTVWINGVPHLVYKNELPDDYPDNTTAVTYDTSSDELEADLGSEYDNTGTVNIRATGGTGYEFGTLWNNFGLWKAIQVSV